MVLASPAPAPSLLSPAHGANNVDPDPTLTWRWVDDLVVNGSFESGMNPGWTTNGPNPALWQVLTSTTNEFGMGYRWATTFMPSLPSARGQLIQDLYVPADATSATLQWKQRIWNLIPGEVIGRLRVYLYENGSALLLLDNATGSEPIYASHNWVGRSTNLLAYAGRTLQLVVQADSYSSRAASSWYADLDGFSFNCEHSTRPEFQVYAGKQPLLRSADLVGQTNELSFSSAVLDPVSTYYWRVDAVRDGVTNQSAVNWFRTGPRILPELRVIRLTDFTVHLGFATHLNRSYTVEQIETLDGSSMWFDATRPVAGTGGPLEVEVLPPTTAAFWRLRISP